MTRTLLCLLIAAPIAGVVSWQMGGIATARGTGVLVGLVVGALVSLWGMYFQRHTLKHRPEKFSNVVVIDFVVRLVVVLAGAIVLTSLPTAAERCDWRAFLLTFASISLLVLTFGTADAVRALGNSSPAEKPVQ